MIYKNENIPNNYNRIAEISDNYIVWVKEATLNSGTSYNAYVQYLNPSFQYYFTSNYKIKKGDNYNIDYNYSTTNFGSYIDNADINYSLTTQSIDNDYISSEDTMRNDYINIFLGQILCCVCILWVFKQMSRLFFRGGLY